MKTHYTHRFIRLICLLIFCTSISNIHAQEDSEILDAYEDYSDAAREVVYMHLNKSTYIKGESIGFTAYVMDKKDKKPSQLTTNLYVSIEDKNKNVVKQKLIKVDNGVATNSFDLDSLFTSGYYNVKAYTNWMLNFNEQNYYVESVRIIDPKNEEYIEEQMVSNTIDAQFLPESGHLLNGVINTIGVVIKDDFGFGIPNSEGEVLGKNNEVLSSFKTNKFGIGKFQLQTEIGNSYKVKITNANKEFHFDLKQNIEVKGIIMSLKSLKSKVYVSLITNEETLNDVKNKRHTLMIHNGNNYDIMDIYFTDETVVTKAIEYSDTTSGVNILTLFNENDKPISERLFFNYEGINILTSNTISASKQRDTVTVKLNFKDINTETINSLSVSVLPEETKSYKRHNNIVSYTFLQPYIKGAVEQAKYYFTDVNAKKQYELDNLLLTQGWSSYNWNEIFENEPNQTHMFEQGIRLKANLPSDISKGPNNAYLMHAIASEDPRIFELSEGENSFLIDNLFPVGEDKIYMSKMTKVNGLLPASLYFQSFPSAIPRLTAESKTLNPKFDYKIEASLKKDVFKKFNFDETQELDEVVVESALDRKRTRMREFNKHKFGKVSAIDEDDRLMFNTLGQFLVSKGFFVIDQGGEFYIEDRTGVNRTPNSLTSSPVFFLDDMYMVDTSIFYQYSLTNVGYIEINRLGIGEGLRGGKGVIKIYSSTKGSKSTNNQDSVQDFKLPLSFSAEKKFYVPKYNSYFNDFYKGYGVIGWEPKVIIDKNGNASFKIVKPRGEITLFIEGIANNGSFIFEEKTISLN
ncbi:hypothetical protein [Winogradskyella sp. PG-2]|uniref:hypothetical protein n=1 Tax=Winogradskyella sp. PG-2 TaxID=754409 RepID=UPI0009FBCDB2|nr:hypothetical protein [Winogradskyella sp. PG-2]